MQDDILGSLAELIEFAESYHCSCASNYSGASNYHGHDCENALVQDFVAEFVAKLEKEELNG